MAFESEAPGQKSLVITEDCPVDKALFLMETTINYEYGHILDSTLVYDKTSVLNFNIETKGTNEEGIALLDGEDLLQKYLEVQDFSNTNEVGKDLMFTNITLLSIQDGVANFTASKTTGNYVGAAILGDLSSYIFPSSFQGVHAITSSQFSGKCGMDYINEKIFVKRNSVTVCYNGGSLIFDNLSNDNNIANAIMVDSWESDPIYGMGRWGIDKQLLYYNYSSWGEILGYQKMNQYLNGAKYIYQVRSSKMQSGRTIIGWSLHWGTWVIHDSYGFPTNQCSSWIIQTTADYHCETLPY